MKLKEFIEQLMHAEFSANVNGIVTQTFNLDNRVSHGYHRFVIECFEGGKLQKHNFFLIKDIPEKLLESTLIKTKITIVYDTPYKDHSIFQFITQLD